MKTFRVEVVGETEFQERQKAFAVQHAENELEACQLASEYLLNNQPWVEIVSTKAEEIRVGAQDYIVVCTTTNKCFHERQWDDKVVANGQSIIDSYFVDNLQDATRYEKEKAGEVCEKLEFLFKNLDFVVVDFSLLGTNPMEYYKELYDKRTRK